MITYFHRSAGEGGVVEFWEHQKQIQSIVQSSPFLKTDFIWYYYYTLYFYLNQLMYLSVSPHHRCWGS